MTVSFKTKTQPRTTDPVEYATVKNPTGYWDLIINKGANGKAIRISNKKGTASVHVGMDKVASLIEALQAVKARGIKTSVNDLPFEAPAARRRANY